MTAPLEQGYRLLVDQIELEDVELLDNPPIIGRFFVFQNKKDKLDRGNIVLVRNFSL